MGHCGSESFESNEMLGGAITHVAREAIARMADVELGHDRISVHLRDNRGGGDRAVDRIAMHQGCLGLSDTRNAPRIDHQMFGRGIERHDGTSHGLEGRVKNVEPVDFFDRHFTDPHGDRLFAHQGVESLAPISAQLLRIIEPRQLDALRQNHSSRNDRPGEGPDPDLVDASHACDTRRKETSATRKKRCQSLSFGAHRLELAIAAIHQGHRPRPWVIAMDVGKGDEFDLDAALRNRSKLLAQTRKWRSRATLSRSLD